VDLSVEGSILLCRQRDQPGIVGTIGTLLAKDGVNINFMTVRACMAVRGRPHVCGWGGGGGWGRGEEEELLVGRGGRRRL